VIIVTAQYARPTYCRFSGCWLADKPVTVSADVEQFGDELLVIWTDETLAKLAELGFSVDELVGAQEAIEAAFGEHEREQCRLASVKQRAGEEVAA
jgi:hypothetical protein